MEIPHLTWSATKCEIAGAGLYIGLAPPEEHDLVARKLDQKQVRIYSGGVVMLRKDAHSPLLYYALRDPSAIRVKPVPQEVRDGFRPVRLLFNFRQPGPAKPASAAVRSGCGEAGHVPSAAADLPTFVLTIGLSVSLEKGFHQDVLCADAPQTFGQLCERLAALGRLDD